MKPTLPMRPTFAGYLRTEDDLRTVLSLPNVIVQPKLGGDRVVLIKTPEGRIEAWNRKGDKYRFKLAPARWYDMPTGMTLDGECYRGDYYPFDCLSYAGTDIAGLPACRRIEYAIEASNRYGLGWCFSRPSFGCLCDKMRDNQGRGQRMMWEGVVVKDANSPYVPLTNYRHESYTWRKYKWL